MKLNKPDSFPTYPNHRVCAIFDERDDARSGFDALMKAGISEDDIEILYGQEGVDILDADVGHKHGILSKVAKIIRLYGDVENEFLHVYQSALDHGGYVFAIRAEDEITKEAIGQCLRGNNAEGINYFGSWVVEAM